MRLAAALLSLTMAVGCGEPDRDLAARHDPILGGALDTSDTWVVALLGNNTECSGFVVDPTHVVTAGHCADPRFPPTRIFIGDDYRDTDAGTLVNVASYLAHPDFSYSGGMLKNDIAVVVAESPLPVITPAPLGTLVPAVQSIVQAIGYGIDDVQAQTGTRRRTVDLTVSGVTGRLQFFTDSTTGKATCAGDSGGPAVQLGHVVGLTSNGDVGCAQASGFTAIAGYNCWLLDAGVATAPCLPADAGTGGGSGSAAGGGDPSNKPGCGCDEATGFIPFALALWMTGRSNRRQKCRESGEARASHGANPSRSMSFALARSLPERRR